MENKIVIYPTSSGFATFIFGQGKCLDLSFTSMDVAMAVAQDYGKQMGLPKFIVHNMDKMLEFEIK
jgi:hypothetical protein